MHEIINFCAFISVEPERHCPCHCRKPSDQGISSWGWNLSGQHSTYHALFPRAWTVYDGINILVLAKMLYVMSV